MSVGTEERVAAGMPLPDRDDVTSRRLVEARLRASPLPDFPGQLPATPEQAYAIQAASIERWPDEVAGWKVAMLPPADRDRFPVQRLAGPVFRSSVYAVEPGSRQVMPVFDGGFAAVEAEFVLKLGETLQPKGRKISDDELIELVSAVHCGAEIASSPVADVCERGATSIIADFGINAGVLVGPAIPDWRSRNLDSLPASVTVDGAVVGSASAAAVPGGFLQVLRFLVDHCAARGIELPAGTLVSSGAVTGVHDVQMSSIARLDFGSLGWFEVSFEPMSPRQ